MPELPEVEVLVRHLAPRLAGRTIRNLQVIDPRSIRHSNAERFAQALTGARFQSLHRRGKYLVFSMKKERRDLPLVGHLGMTGRLSISPRTRPLPRHATVVFSLGRDALLFEDVRRFGGLTLDASAINRLGPEPLGRGFTVDALARCLSTSRQAIKVRLLDQHAVAGIGNIYASEALFQAKINPRTPSRSLSPASVRRLRIGIRRVLSRAIRFGSTVPLDFEGTPQNDGLFYYGQSSDDSGQYDEQLQVYGREAAPCRCCGTHIRKLVQAGRSTFLCPHCQN